MYRGPWGAVVLREATHLSWNLHEKAIAIVAYGRPAYLERILVSILDRRSCGDGYL